VYILVADEVFLFQRSRNERKDEREGKKKRKEKKKGGWTKGMTKQRADVQ